MSLRHALLALLVAFLWGTNFTVSKLGMEHFSPTMFLILRFSLVVLVTLPFIFKGSICKWFALKISVVLATMHFALMFTGIYLGVDIPTAVITIQLGVPFSCILSAFMFGDRLGPWRSFGLVIAFLGVVMIAGTPNVVDNLLGFWLVLVAAICWAWSNVMIKKEGHVNVLEMLGWMSLFAVPQLMVLSFIFDAHQWQQLVSARWFDWAGIAYTAMFSTVIAYGLWYWLLTQCSVSQVAPYNLLVTVFAVAVGQYVYPVELTWQMYIGGLITIMGVAIIILRKPRLANFDFRLGRKKTHE